MRHRNERPKPQSAVLAARVGALEILRHFESKLSIWRSFVNWALCGRHANANVGNMRKGIKEGTHFCLGALIDKTAWLDLLLGERITDRCAVALRKRAWNTARSFFDSDRAAVLNVRARLVIGFMKQDIVQLPHINHFSASAFVEVLFLRFTQLVKVSGIHFS
jgi:hypothetical protein